MSFAAFFGMVARDYLRRHSVNEPELFAVVEHNLNRGRENPVVSRRREFDLAGYLASPFVAEPLRVADACTTTDGAAAVVVCSSRRRSQASRGVEVLACEQGTGSSSTSDLSHLAGFDVVRRVAAQAYREAGITPQDVNVVEVHDAFSISQLVDLEDLGFYRPGCGLSFLESQDTFYVNPSGGLLARGHPIAATGLAQIYELVRQLRGDSHYQHPSPRFALGQVVGGIGGYATVSILAHAA
jgi:acetyl-CoA acetyltransferase